MKKIIASFVFLFSFSVFAQNSSPSLVPGQVYTTGDIVQPTISYSNTTPWVNGVYQDSLTCWAWGNPGYCGPNAIVRPGNNINFSFGTTNLYQMQLISSLLPNNGTGLRVDGYNFSFTAKNGNGWDDGRLDYLTAYVSFYDSKGATVFNKNYSLNYQFNWTTFNYSETFNTPFASKDLGSVQYGFVGRDNNGWAGPYGPEVNNVSFSLKYSVDPCAGNPLYNPTCPGYMEALAKLAPAPTTTTSEIATTTTTTTLQSPTTATVSQTPVVESVAPTTSSSSVVLTSTGNNKETTVNSSGVSIGLSVVARNAQREQSIAMQAAQNAVAATEQTAQQAQQEAVSVAQSSSAASNVSSVNPTARINLTTQRSEQVVAQTQSSQSSSSVSVFSQPGVQVQPARLTDTNRFGLTSSISTETGNIQSTPLNIALQEQNTNSQTQTSFTLLPPQQVQQTSVSVVSVFASDTTQFPAPLLSTSQQTFFATNETPSSDSQKFLTDKSNPINQILESKPELPSSSSIQPKTTVNTNASDNEIAGAVNIGRMATSPVGYNQYLNLVIADAAFYAPKEIYKGQRNVDNVRALRSMSSDRLHQEMVNQQYRK